MIRIELDHPTRSGDLVLIERSLRARGEKKKLGELPKKGPYKIVKTITDLNFQVVSTTNPNEEYIVHVQQMCPYTSRRSVLEERQAEDPFVDQRPDVSL